MRKAVLDQTGRVIGEAFDVPKNLKTIYVTNLITKDGDAVNVRAMKTSYSSKLLEKASYMQPLEMYTYAGTEYWTFHAVVNNKIVF